jgi:hypothetical protein
MQFDGQRGSETYRQTPINSERERKSEDSDRESARERHIYREDRERYIQGVPSLQ